MTVNAGDVIFGVTGSAVVYMIYRSAARRYLGITSKVADTVRVVRRAPRVLSSAVYKGTRVSCKLVGRATRVLPRRMDAIKAHLTDLCKRADSPFSRRLSSYLDSALDIKSDFRELYMYLYKDKKFDNPLISLLHSADEIDSVDILGENELARIQHCYANDDRMVEAVLRELVFRDNPVRSVLVINHDLSISCVAEKPTADYLFPKSVAKDEIGDLVERSIYFGNVRVTDEQINLSRTLRKHMVSQECSLPIAEDIVNVKEVKRGMLSFLNRFKTKVTSKAISSDHIPSLEETEMENLMKASKQTEVKDTVESVTDIAGIELTAEESANVSAASGLLLFASNPATIAIAVVSAFIIGSYFVHRQVVRNHMKEVDESAAAIAEYDPFAHFVYAVSCARYDGEMPVIVKTAICRRINNNLAGYSILCDDYIWLHMKYLETDVSEASNVLALVDEYCDEFKLNSLEFAAYDLKSNRVMKVKTCVVPLYYPTLKLHEVKGCLSLQMALNYVKESTDAFLVYLGIGFAPSAHVLSNYHHGYKATMDFWSINYEKNPDHYVDISESLVAIHRYQVTPSTLFGDSQLVAEGMAELPNVRTTGSKRVPWKYTVSLLLPPVALFVDQYEYDVIGYSVNDADLFSGYLEDVALMCADIHADLEHDGFLDMARNKALSFAEYSLSKISDV